MIKPDWLKKSPVAFSSTVKVRAKLGESGLNTVCRSARCPNMRECFSHGTATFLILGDSCTRDCGFCAVTHGKPRGMVDDAEPERVAQAALEMGLRHVVVTSVTRDDLPDGGAGIFARTIRSIHGLLPNAGVEALTPDFNGELSAIDAVAQAGPQVYNHNIETVRALYPIARPQAAYERSLALLSHVRRGYPGVLVKSGFMLGLGETREQVMELMNDLLAAGCQMVTIGQYLQPTRANLPVAEYVEPERFSQLARMGEEMGFTRVFAGPFVRSSYMAETALKP